jgi:hypothetical protein
MLSIVDLIDAGTFSPDLAAYALAAIGKGASFMVGAVPGGAGKTTVMGALLNFVPADVSLVTADGLATIEQGLKKDEPHSPSPGSPVFHAGKNGGAGVSRSRGTQAKGYGGVPLRSPALQGGELHCYICHEIGDGGYYAYLWGGVLRRYFELSSAGHMLATNLHADTCEQAHRQVCHDNGVPEDAFRKINLLFFLSLKSAGGVFARRISAVWESDGKSPHRALLAGKTSALPMEGSRLVTRVEVQEARVTIDKLMASGVRTIQEVRAAILSE